MCKAIITGLVLFSCLAQATTRIAVIDSGFTGKGKLCATGHYDFIEHKLGVGVDLKAHGTVVSKAIEANASGNYCLIIHRVFGNKSVNINDIIQAINLAVTQKVNVINLSMEGGIYNTDEFDAIKNATKHGIKVFVASGNDSKNLDVHCNIFPACYTIQGITVVGSIGQTRANYGHVVTQKEDYCFENTCGTSMSTAIATGKYVKDLK